MTRCVHLTIGVLAAAACAAFAPSASGSSIVYVCAADLCRVDPKKPKEVERLTRDGTRRYPYEGPSLSHNGRRLLFKHESRRRGSRLYLARGDATRRRDLGDASTTTQWYLRPDGGGMAFTLNVYTIIYFGPTPDQNIWGFQNQLYQLPFDGRGPRGNVSGGHVISAGWLGNRLFRQLDPADHDRDIICLTPVTQSNSDCRGTIAQDPTRHLGAADGSDNGRWVVAVAERPGEERDYAGPLALYDARTARQVRDLTRGPRDGAAEFSPDGKSVVFNRGRALYVVGIRAGSKPRRIVRSGFDATWGGP